MWLWVFSIIATVEKLVDEAFHCFLQLDVLLGLAQDLTPTDDIIFHHMFVQRVGDRIPLMNARAAIFSLQLCTLAN